MLAVALGLMAATGAVTLTPSTATAQENPPPDPRNLCPWMVAEGYFRNYGDCMSGYRIGDAAFCMRMERSMLELMGFRNQGECVARMREFERRR